MKVRQGSGKRRSSGMSRRGYAERRGVSDATVRRHLTSGLLAPALLPDDTIDADLADAILARSLTRSSAIPAVDAARKRKLAAEIAMLQDEVTTLIDERVSPAAAREFVRDLLTLCAKQSIGVVDAGAGLAGHVPVDCFTTLTEAVFTSLTAIAETRATTRTIEDEAAPTFAGVRLDALELTDLVALKADLQAQRLETLHATARGEMVLIAAIETDIIDRIANFRARLLAIPSRGAPLFQTLATADEARALTLELSAEALAQLAGDEMDEDELTEILRNA